MYLGTSNVGPFEFLKRRHNVVLDLIRRTSIMLFPGPYSRLFLFSAVDYIAQTGHRPALCFCSSPTFLLVVNLK